MKICIVTTDLQGFIKNGGVGTSNSNLANYLAGTHDVDILFVHNPNQEKELEFKIWKNIYKKQKINIISLFYPPYHIDSGFLYATLSYLVYQNLKHASYDQIIFPEMHGLGYYSMLGKQAGTAFYHTKLITMYHGPGEWHVRFNNGLPSSYSELVTYYIEKQSCLISDYLFFATEHAKKSAVEMGYFPDNSDKTQVALYPFNGPSDDKDFIYKNKKFKEVCFFGRIETRKGIEVFCKAMALLKEQLQQNEIQVTLIGVNGYVNSIDAGDFVKSWIEIHGVKLKVINDFDKLSAFTYIKKNNVLVILPSIEETMGYTLIECLIDNIPYICSDIASFKEIINYFKPKVSHTFENLNHQDLAKKISHSLGTRPKMPDALNSLTEHRQFWLSSLEKLNSKNTVRPETKPEKLSMCTVYSDRPQFLAQLLLSVEPLKNSLDEILIYINKSDSKESKKFIDNLKHNPKIKVIKGERNVSPGKGRNILSAEAKNEAILFVDDDNLIDFKVFKKILTNMDSSQWDVVCSPLKKFNDSKISLKLNENGTPLEQYAIIERTVETHWLPIGNEISLNLHDNRLGDCNLLIKKTTLQNLGGFNEELFYGEDQELLTRLIHRGARYILSPESFIHYRLHETNLTKNIDHVKASGLVSEIILRNLGMNNFFPLFQMIRAWNFEKSRHPHYWQLEMIHKKSLENQYGSLKNKKKIGTLQKIIKNKINFVKDQGFIECETKLPVKLPPPPLKRKKQIELVLYAKSNTEFQLNDSFVKLESGYSNILVEFDQTRGLSFFSPVIQSIFIIDAIFHE